MEPESKALAKSKTAWGAAIAVAAPALPSVAKLFGFEMSNEDAQLIVQLVSNIVGAVGGLLVMYGRVKATRKIDRLF